MDGDRILEAILGSKPGTEIVDKRSRSGVGGKPGILTLWFSDGTNVSFPRADALKIKTEEQLAAFVARLAG